jgi:hypothetical protein
MSKIGSYKRNNLRELALLPPQNAHDLTWVRTWAVPGIRKLTASVCFLRTKHWENLSQIGHVDSNPRFPAIGDGKRGTGVGDWSHSDQISATVTSKGRQVNGSRFASTIRTRKYTVTCFTALNISCNPAKLNYRINWNMDPVRTSLNRLCGIVVRVPGYRSRGPGWITVAAKFSEK